MVTRKSSEEKLREDLVSSAHYTFCSPAQMVSLSYKTIKDTQNRVQIRIERHPLFSDLQLYSPWPPLPTVLIHSSSGKHHGVGPSLAQIISCTCTSISSRWKLTLLIRKGLATLRKLQNLIKFRAACLVLLAILSVCLICDWQHASRFCSPLPRVEILHLSAGKIL